MLQLRLSPHWRGPALGGLWLALLLACSPGEELPPSGILITLDTTNASALDFYGKDRGLTPNLLTLSQSGLTFDQAYTTAPITLPAHTSMLTGLYPIRHGVRENGLMQLSSTAETLAERAQAAGFQTAAFISAVVLSRTYGLDQGFDVYEGPPPGKNRPGAAMGERRSNEVTDAALAWLAGRDRERPFFLWVHYFDPHAPYDPPPAFLERSGGNPYLGEVAAMDADIGRLLAGLDQDPGAERLMLAMVADHGESHGRHGEPSHAAFCYEPTTHIPFVLRFPDGRRAGERSADFVSVVDVFPTFLDELGLGGVVDIDGLSLARGEIPAGRGLYFESYYGYFNFGWSPLAGWVDARGKYLHSSSPEFYVLADDPKETKNLFGVGDLDTAPYAAAIEALSKRSRLEPGNDVQLSPEQVAELRSLGYATVGSLGQEGPPDPLEPSDAMAPSEGTATYADFCAASYYVQEQEVEKGVKILRAIIEQNPDHVYALETLGGALLEQQQYAEAIGILERILVIDAGRYATQVYLAMAFEALGQFESTLKHYRAAQAIRPNEAGLVTEIERVKQRAGL